MQRLQVLRGWAGPLPEACAADAVAGEGYVLQSGGCSRLWGTLWPSVWHRAPAI